MDIPKGEASPCSASRRSSEEWICVDDEDGDSLLSSGNDSQDTRLPISYRRSEDVDNPGFTTPSSISHSTSHAHDAPICDSEENKHGGSPESTTEPIVSATSDRESLDGEDISRQDKSDDEFVGDEDEDEDAYEGEWGDDEDEDENDGEDEGEPGWDGDEANSTLQRLPETLEGDPALAVHQALEASSMPVKFPWMLKNESVPSDRSEFETLREMFIAARSYQASLEKILAKQRRQHEDALSDVEIANANLRDIKRRVRRTELQLEETVGRISELQGAIREAMQMNNTAVVSNKIENVEQKENVQRVAAFQDSYKLGIALNQSGIYAGEGALSAAEELDVAKVPGEDRVTSVVCAEAQGDGGSVDGNSAAVETFLSGEIAKRLKNKERKPAKMMRRDLLEENEMMRNELFRLEAKYASLVFGEGRDASNEVGNEANQPQLQWGVAGVGEESEPDADEELAKFYQREEDARLARELAERPTDTVESDAKLAREIDAKERAASYVEYIKEKRNEDSTKQKQEDGEYTLIGPDTEPGSNNKDPEEDQREEVELSQQRANTVESAAMLARQISTQYTGSSFADWIIDKQQRGECVPNSTSYEAFIKEKHEQRSNKPGNNHADPQEESQINEQGYDSDLGNIYSSMNSTMRMKVNKTYTHLNAENSRREIGSFFADSDSDDEAHCVPKVVARARSNSEGTVYAQIDRDSDDAGGDSDDAGRDSDDAGRDSDNSDCDSNDSGRDSDDTDSSEFDDAEMLEPLSAEIRSPLVTDQFLVDLPKPRSIVSVTSATRRARRMAQKTRRALNTTPTTQRDRDAFESDIDLVGTFADQCTPRELQESHPLPGPSFAASTFAASSFVAPSFADSSFAGGGLHAYGPSARAYFAGNYEEVKTPDTPENRLPVETLHPQLNFIDAGAETKKLDSSVDNDLGDEQLSTNLTSPSVVTRDTRTGCELPAAAAAATTTPAPTTAAGGGGQGATEQELESLGDDAEALERLLGMVEERAKLVVQFKRLTHDFESATTEASSPQVLDSNTAQALHQVPSTAPQAPWTIQCPRCTLINHVGNGRCSLCEAPLDASRHSAAPSTALYR